MQGICIYNLSYPFSPNSGAFWKNANAIFQKGVRIFSYGGTIRNA